MASNTPVLDDIVKHCEQNNTNIVKVGVNQVANLIREFERKGIKVNYFAGYKWNGLTFYISNLPARANDIVFSRSTSLV